MTSYRLAVVGGGNMGAALVGGLLHGDWRPTDLAVVELSAARAAQLGEMFPGVAVATEVPSCDAALIAVKPNDVPGACAAAARAGATRILSIAAGISVEALQEAAGPDVVIVRSMPNTPALVGEGAAAICGGATAEEADLAWAESILGSVGIVVRVPESQLDAVTGLAGSGPAYLFLVAEALTDAGVLAGLSRANAEQLVHQLFVGSAKLLAENGNPAQLRANVTSPGGTTAAGLRVLEEHAVRSAFLEAVMAAAARGAELGKR
ncbi:MAG: pyrroline-5-carboxylate reductase [Actinomycetota bacterium]|jgi:pyrroline-5-carboxylate reductase